MEQQINKIRNAILNGTLQGKECIIAANLLEEKIRQCVNRGMIYVLPFKISQPVKNSNKTE